MRRLIAEAQDLTRTSSLDAAGRRLQRLHLSWDYLPLEMQLKVHYVEACIHSRQSQRMESGTPERVDAINQSLAHLQQWIQLGQAGGWSASGDTAQNEID